VTEVSQDPEEMGWRVPVTILAFFGDLIALVLWLLFYAESFNPYQNAGVVIVIFLAFAATMGATWASWGMRQGGRLMQAGGQK